MSFVNDETELEAVLQGNQGGEGADVARVMEETLSHNEAPVELGLDPLVLVLNGLEHLLKVGHVIVLVILDMGARDNDSLLQSKANALITVKNEGRSSKMVMVS